jgi:glycosyltransferase involved in cell wall biosynthesis
MATYNGGKYLTRQLDSILSQIKSTDEVVIVDDCSTDDTVEIIKNYNCNNIKLFLNDRNQGHVGSFEKAISLAKNDIILLSDQDDVWLPERLNKLIVKCYIEQTALLTSNFGLIDENDLSLPDPKYSLREIDSNLHFSNITNIFLGKRPYFGCAMILRRDLIDIAFPFPAWVEGHDVWFALCSNALQSNSHFELKTINRRLHSSNLTSLNRRPLLDIAVTRYRMFMCTITILFRLVRRAVLIRSTK